MPRYLRASATTASPVDDVPVGVAEVASVAPSSAAAKSSAAPDVPVVTRSVTGSVIAPSPGFAAMVSLMASGETFDGNSSGFDVCGVDGGGVAFDREVDVGDAGLAPQEVADRPSDEIKREP